MKYSELSDIPNYPGLPYIVYYNVYCYYCGVFIETYVYTKFGLDWLLHERIVMYWFSVVM